MKFLLAFALLLPSLTFAQQDVLKMGSRAPALMIEKWARGSSIEAFHPGQIYVVEFWGTWCPPCVEAMPHLMELQNQYEDDITVIGVAASEQGKPDEAYQKMDAWLTEKFPSINYRIAYDSTGTMKKNWMEAAVAMGIPTSFVVGRDGKIAFIGHPMELDAVLPKIVAGTWTGSEEARKNDEERITQSLERKRTMTIQKAVFAEYNAAFEKQDWPAAVKALEGGLQQLPGDMQLQTNLLDLVLHKMRDFAKGFALVDKHIEKYFTNENPYFLVVALEQLFHPEENYQHLPREPRFALGKKLVEKILKEVPLAGDNDTKFFYYIPAAQYYFEARDRAMAQALAEAGLKSVEQHPMAEKIIPKFGKPLAQVLANLKGEPVCIGPECVLPQKACEGDLAPN